MFCCDVAVTKTMAQLYQCSSSANVEAEFLLTRLQLSASCWASWFTRRTGITQLHYRRVSLRVWRDGPRCRNRHSSRQCPFRTPGETDRAKKNSKTPAFCVHYMYIHQLWDAPCHIGEFVAKAQSLHHTHSETGKAVNGLKYMSTVTTVVFRWYSCLAVFTDPVRHALRRDPRSSSHWADWKVTESKLCEDSPKQSWSHYLVGSGPVATAM